MITQNQSQIPCGAQELTADEVDLVSGGSGKTSGCLAIAVAVGIGAATCGKTWVAVGAAVAFGVGL